MYNKNERNDHYNLGRAEGVWNELNAFVENKLRWATPISRNNHHQLDALLFKYSRFYRDLDDAHKAKAINRIVLFAADKEFKGHNLAVTQEMKWLISWACVKITFGVPDFLIKHLETIGVFPEAYYSRMVGGYVKGLTSEKGVVSLSWADVLHGFENDEDGLTVAVHEMAHAVYIDTVKGDPQNDHFAFELNRWRKNARQEVAATDSTFIRPYARTNDFELFAVCVENLIERPEAFKEKMPRLYYHTAYLLNQDPGAVTDRKITPAFLRTASKVCGRQFDAHPQRDYTHHSGHWSLYFFGASVLVAPIIIGAHTANNTYIFSLWWVYFLCIAISGALLLRPVLLSRAMTKEVYPYFIAFGAAPALMAFLVICDDGLVIKRGTEHHRIGRLTKSVLEPGVLIANEVSGRFADSSWVNFFHGNGLPPVNNIEYDLELTYTISPLGCKKYTVSRLLDEENHVVFETHFE